MNANDCLKDLSLSQNSSFFENSQFAPTSVLGEVYNIFEFEPVHNLHQRISKQLKYCTIKFPGSYWEMIKSGEVIEHKQLLIWMILFILRGVNPLFATIDRNAGVPGLLVNFSSKSSSVQLNGIFLNRDVREMLEGKEYRAVDMILSIMGTYIDCAMCFQVIQIWLVFSASIPIWCPKYFTELCPKVFCSRTWKIV